MSLFGKAVASALPAMPRRLVHSVAKRYIAGETVESALDCVERLNEQGAAATVDVLGENIETLDQAQATHDEYATLLASLDERGLDGNVSIKLTALGLHQSVEACEGHVRSLCTIAAERDNFIRIDMEDSSITQATLDLYDRLRAEHENLGPVLQAYLRRTNADARKLAEHQASVRLCKGIYIEPRAIAWRDRTAVQKNFVRVLRTLLEGGCYVGIATHDELLVYEALALVEDLELAPEDYEFQMLLGVDEEMRKILIDGGHRMRVYVPYGASWYDYSLRRLKENPEIATHVAKATLKR
ncbi:MAG: proline dehydrogenase family protein [Acidobacteriota bacterium]